MKKSSLVNLKSIKNEVLTRIKPTPQEKAKFKRVSRFFLRHLNSKLKRARAILGGSGAKDTWLSGNHDIDIFVLFNYRQFSNQSAGLSEFLSAALKKAFPKEKISRVHGSRDYFQLHYQNFFFEVVPILEIKTSASALNITDISPLHSRWINKHTKSLKDEIRIAKQFCRAQGVYGAESYIGGFSGYVIEILLETYGSFEKLLMVSANWQVNEVVDVENHYRGKDALFEINSSKHSPLVVIDPVDKSRNAAAALTMEKFLQFKQKAEEFLRKPDLTFFEKESINLDLLRRRFSSKNIIYLEVAELTGKKDVVGSKLLKAFTHLKENLKSFELIFAGWSWNTFYFIVNKNKLPNYEERIGPPLHLKEALAAFKKKNATTYIRSGRIYAKINRRNPHLKEAVKWLLSSNYLKDKFRSVKKCTVL